MKRVDVAAPGSEAGSPEAYELTTLTIKEWSFAELLLW
jgi:hypothetical protein